MKKLLSIVLALALCLTAFVGCLTVSAAGENTIVVDTANITTGAATTDVKVTITSAGVMALQFAIDYDAALATPAVAYDEAAVTVTATEDKTGLIVEADANFTSTVITLTFDTAALTAGTYAIAVNDVEAGNYDETIVAFETTAGAIVVADAVVAAVSSLELYLNGVLSETIAYDSLATALVDAAEYANTKSGGYYYDPVLVLNKDTALTEDIEVGAYTTFNLGDYTIDTAGYAFNITSSGVVKANYQVADFATNVFYNEAVANDVYTYTAKLQMTVSSVSLVLSNTIFVQYKASVSNKFTGDVEYGIAYTKGDDDTVYDISQSSEDSTIVLSGKNIIADTFGIRSSEMSTDIVAHFYAKTTIDGVDYYVYSNTLTYSVLDYATTILAGDDEVAIDLMKAMLNYGAQAQLNFGIKTDALANAVLDEADRVIPTDLGEDILVPALTQPSMGYTSDGYCGGAALELEEAINIWFTPKAMKANYDYKLLVWNAAEYAALATDGANLEEVLVAENCNTILTLNENNVFVLEGIAAKKFADTYYVRLVEDTGSGLQFDSVLTYSATQYCIDSIAKGAKESDLCRAIALYSAAARTYFDNYVINSCVD